MRTCLFVACLLISITTISQPLEFGVGLTLGYSVPEKLETGVNSPVVRLGSGITTSLRYQLNPKYSLYTGLNLIRKPSFIEHIEFYFPDLRHSGSFKLGMKNNVLQIPLLISRTFSISDNRFFEIQLGVNASILKPKVYMSSSNWSADYQGNDTMLYEFTGSKPDYKAKYGLELNCGLAYTFKTNAESKKYHSIGIGIERTFFNGPTINYKVELSNSTQTKTYSISEAPKLWFFKVAYMFYFYSIVRD